jgi:uncharacterized membrane protein YkvA (DUF1232 family)
VKAKRLALARNPKRNRAFVDALARARAYARDPKALRALFQEAMRKTSPIPKAPFKDLWGYFQAMLRLIRAYYRGEYRAISVTNLVMIIGAIIYVLNPWDWIPTLGFVDDATILAFAVQKTREARDDFTSWEITAR